MEKSEISVTQNYHTPCPSRCFCKYDADELKEVAYKKIIQKVPTLELLGSAKSQREKELISVVAMLDLDDNVAEIMIREKMSAESCDVLGCREGLKQRLLKLISI